MRKRATVVGTVLSEAIEFMGSLVLALMMVYFGGVLGYVLLLVVTIGFFFAKNHRPVFYGLLLGFLLWTIWFASGLDFGSSSYHITRVVGH